jgi:tetratricopeptide (TPR) repeat protein
VSFDRAVVAEPNDANVWGSRADVLSRMRRYEDALESCEKALSLNGADDRVLSIRGYVYNVLGRYNEALQDFDNALLLRSDAPNTWDRRGDALMYLGEPARALESYENALKLSPTHFHALSSRGDALQHLSRYEEAVASYDSAIAVRPASGATWARRGQALFSLKRFSEAAASFERARSLDPRDYEAYVQQAFSLAQANELDRALEAANAAVSLAPPGLDRYFPLKVRAIIHHLKRMHEEAMCDLLAAWKLNPDELMRDQVAHGLIAAVYNSALKSADSVLMLAEMEWSAATMHVSAGDKTEARRLAENATEILESMVGHDDPDKLQSTGNVSGAVVTGVLTRSARRLVDGGDRELAREHVGRMTAWVSKISGDTLTPLDDILGVSSGF